MGRTARVMSLCSTIMCDVLPRINLSQILMSVSNAWTIAIEKAMLCVLIQMAVSSAPAEKVFRDMEHFAEVCVCVRV